MITVFKNYNGCFEGLNKIIEKNVDSIHIIFDKGIEKMRAYFNNSDAERRISKKLEEGLDIESASTEVIKEDGMWDNKTDFPIFLNDCGKGLELTYIAGIHLDEKSNQYLAIAMPLFTNNIYLKPCKRLPDLVKIIKESIEEDESSGFGAKLKPFFFTQEGKANKSEEEMMKMKESYQGILEDYMKHFGFLPNELLVNYEFKTTYLQLIIDHWSNLRALSQEEIEKCLNLLK